MAILNSIRKRGIFLILIIAMALFAFILSDILTSGAGMGAPKGQTNIATINGIDIPRQSFMEQVDMAQRNYGPNATTTQVMNLIWDQELRRVILEEQIEKAGISAEKTHLDNALRSSLANNPTFLNEAGQVDNGKIQEYIASIKSSSPQMFQQWVKYEKGIEEGVMQSTYFNMVKGGLRSTIAEGEQEYHFQNDKINFSYVLVPYSSIEEEIAVTDSEIEKYVAAHKADFQTEAKADIQYVLFSETPSEADIEEAKQASAALLDNKIEFNNETKSNDTIPGFRDTQNAEEFVAMYSDVPFVDKWMFKNEMEPTIADTLINMEVGDVYGPYKLNNTFNLTKVLDVKKMPDSAESKHILIRYAGTLRAPETITRTKEEARNLADSLLAVVKRDKSKFADLAKEFSDDSSKDNGGDLGNSTPGRMVPPFDEFIFNNKTGTIGLVETDFGYHIVEVGKQSEDKKAIKVATVVTTLHASEKTINDVFSSASKFELAVQKEDFAKVAEEQNLEVKPVNRIGEMDETIPGIENNRAIVNWAFEKNTDVGDTKRFSVSDGYVIVQLTQRNEKGLMPASQAATTVKPILIKEKKAKKIRESISGNTLEEIAKNQSVSIQNASEITMANPRIGNASEPKVIGKAFGTKAGESTPLIDGNEGVYMVRVNTFVPAPKLDSYVSQANQLNSKEVSAAQSRVIEALKKKAEIEDHRANFY